MVVFPNAKINLGLYILKKRTDGYHDIESCFYPIDLSDILEVIPSQKLTFTSSGLDIPGSADDNLCLQAYHLLRHDFSIEPVHIHLHKMVPIGAGLGGGSSDASFTLKALNQLFELGLDSTTLEQYAARLGSDCPFFIKNEPVIAYGRGTTFNSIALDLSAYHIEVAFPDLHISTREAYAGITPKIPDTSVSDIISQPVDTWKERLKNDFETSILPRYAKIEQLKNKLYANGALYASMTGSGSAVYGIFERPRQDIWCL